MTFPEALALLAKHGVMLEAGAGPVPSIAAAIAGGAIRGSWWGHPKGRAIFAITRQIRDSPDVLVCRLIGGKISYVHRRLWPALVRVSDRFPRARLAMLHEVHTASGKHVIKEIRFPDWVPGKIRAQAKELDETTALSALGSWCAGVRR